MTLYQLEKRAESIEDQVQSLILDIMNETHNYVAEIEEKNHERSPKVKIPRAFYTGNNRVLHRLIAARDALHMAHIIAEGYPDRFPDNGRSEG